VIVGCYCEDYDLRHHISRCLGFPPLVGTGMLAASAAATCLREPPVKQYTFVSPATLLSEVYDNIHDNRNDDDDGVCYFDPLDPSVFYVRYLRTVQTMQVVFITPD